MTFVDIDEYDIPEEKVAVLMAIEKLEGGDVFEISARRSSIQSPNSNSQPIRVKAHSDDLSEADVQRIDDQFSTVFKHVCRQLEAEIVKARGVLYQEDTENFRVESALAFVDKMWVKPPKKVGGDIRELEPSKMVYLARNCGLDTPYTVAPLPMGMRYAILDRDEELFGEWVDRLKSAPIQFGRVDYRPTYEIRFAQYAPESKYKELSWTI